MSEPRTGPEDQPGYPSDGSMPAGQGQPAGPGAAGASAAGASATGREQPEAGSVTTAGRTADVPPQYSRDPADSRAAEPGYGREGTGTSVGDDSYRDVASGSALIAATAGRTWGAVLLGGLCLLAAGVILLVWPRETLNVVAIIIGAAVVASGVVRLWEGFSARGGESGGMRAAYVVIGLLAIIVGVYLIRHHTLSLFLVAFVTGLYFILHGISDLGVATSAKGMPGRGLRAVLGVVSLAAGIVMIVWPSITLVLLFTIVAAWLLFYGLMLCFLAYGLRKAGKLAEAELSEREMAGRPMAAAAR